MTLSLSLSESDSNIHTHSEKILIICQRLRAPSSTQEFSSRDSPMVEQFGNLNNRGSNKMNYRPLSQLNRIRRNLLFVNCTQYRSPRGVETWNGETASRHIFLFSNEGERTDCKFFTTPLILRKIEWSVKKCNDHLSGLGMNKNRSTPRLLTFFIIEE